MKNYEAMFILKTDLEKEKMQELLGQVNETIKKNKGEVSSAEIWAEKRRLVFTIKKQQEGTYYLVSFKADPLDIAKMNQEYRLNDNIVRVMISSLQKE